MKKKIFIFCLATSILLILPVHIGTFKVLQGIDEVDLELKWSHLFKLPLNQNTHQIISTSDGGYLIGANSALDSSGEDKELLLIKTDVNGTEQWNKTLKYHLTPHSNLRSVIQTSDGGFAIAGLTGSSSDYSSWEAWVIKTDVNGNEQWNYTYNGAINGPDYASQILVTSDGGFLIAGATQSITAGEELWNTDYWLIKTDANGVEQWNKTYNRVGSDQAFSFIPILNNHYIIGGLSRKTSESDSPHLVWLVKIDESGTVIWDKTYESSKSWTGILENNLIGTSDGGFLLASYTIGQVYFMGEDFWIVKADSNGEIEWTKTIGGTFYDTPSVSVESETGDYYIGGSLNSKTGGEETGDMGIIKITASGDVLWELTHGEEQKMDRIADMILTEGTNINDGLVVLAQTESFGAEGSDIWLGKYEETNGGETIPGFSLLLPLIIISIVYLYKRKIGNKI
ncbi:MAG: hypothetical protein ACW981_18730 [Candidatus Hodarchaeales archaeon]|jgi:hypothetical protein